MTDIIVATTLWNLCDVELISDGPSSRVYRAQRDGQSIVAKILKPAGMDETMGMDLLRWQGGRGAVRLLAQQDHAYLLEDGGRHTLLQRFADGGDDATVRQLASVLVALHAASEEPPPVSLMSLDRQFEALFRPVAHPALRKKQALVGWAADMARRLLASQNSIRPLHGDMHHENVVSPDGLHWRAIDPKGLIGDPAYDYANIFGNPIGARDVVLDRDRPLRLVTCFVEVSGHFGSNDGLDAVRILEFAAANSVLSARWSLEESQSEDDFRQGLQRLELAENLRALLDRR